MSITFFGGLTSVIYPRIVTEINRSILTAIGLERFVPDAIFSTSYQRIVGAFMLGVFVLLLWIVSGELRK